MSFPQPTSWRENMRSPLMWHLTGLGTLSLLVVALTIWLAYAWTFNDANAERSLNAKRTELQYLALDTAPLRGLDRRVAATRAQIEDFYADRIPANYSLVATRVSELEIKSGVRLSHIAYTQGGAGVDLTEISMEASVTGSYPQIMHFVNSLERDQLFFVIRAMALNSQQSGLVNLRLRASTWLRSADAMASGLPLTTTRPPARPETPKVKIAAGATGREGF